MPCTWPSDRNTSTEITTTYPKLFLSSFQNSMQALHYNFKYKQFISKDFPCGFQEPHSQQQITQAGYPEGPSESSMRCTVYLLFNLSPQGRRPWSLLRHKSTPDRGWPEEDWPQDSTFNLMLPWQPGLTAPVDKCLWQLTADTTLLSTSASKANVEKRWASRRSL